MRMWLACVVGALLLFGCDDTGRVCEGELCLECPDEPPCTNRGCIDGVAWTCETGAYGGMCGQRQGPSFDCAAAGLVCRPDSPWSYGGYCAPAGCGDGVLQDDEACDDGADNGTSRAACGIDCSPPRGVVADAVPSDGYETVRLEYDPDRASAEQSFVVHASGVLIRLELSEALEDVWIQPGDVAAPSRQIRAKRVTTATGKMAFEFDVQVRMQAGETWLLGVRCPTWGCTIPLLLGDPLPDGSFALRPRGAWDPPPFPAGADLWFKLWIVPDVPSTAERAR